MSKTLHNCDSDGARKNVKDLKVFGDPDLFQLLSKASSKSEGWMKSTKAMAVPGRGCIVQITTQQGDNIAEAAVFMPNVTIDEFEGPDKDGNIVTHKRLRGV